MDEAIEQGRLTVVVRRAEIKRTNSAVVSGMPTYKMDARPRGLALIIEIDEFVNNTYEKRVGSEVSQESNCQKSDKIIFFIFFQFDVTNLTDLLRGLFFEVQIERNLNRRAFDDKIHSFANDRRHASADMMVLAILSHGRDGQIYTSDSNVVATEAIYEKFNNEYCPALSGKPKFFIIQVRNKCVTSCCPTRDHIGRSTRNSNPVMTSSAGGAKGCSDHRFCAHSTYTA